MESQIKFYYEEKYNPLINENAFDARIKSVEYSPAPKPYKGLRLGCITFENELKSIGSEAITEKNSEWIDRVVLPNSIVSLKADSFHTRVLECDLYDKEGNLIIEGRLIRKKNTLKGTFSDGPKEINIPEGVTTIEDYIEWEEFPCYDIRKIILPSTLKYIGKNAFRGFDLTSIKLPKDVEIIESHAFDSCNIKTLTIPDKVKMIGDFAFRFCNDLKKVKIGKNVESIGTGIFAGNNKIESFEGKYSTEDNNCLMVDNILLCVASKSIPTEFEIPSDVKKIASYAFSSIELDKLTIPESVEIIEENSFDKCRIKKFEGKFVENRMVIANGILIKAEYNDGNYKEDLMILEKVSKIGAGALSGTCYDIHLPSHLKIIGPSAFSAGIWSLSNCQGIQLPETLEEIERDAFSNWNSFQFKDRRFIIPKNVKFIGKGALTCNGGDIWFEPIVPPVFEDKGILWPTNIFVPADSIEAYKEALPKSADKISIWER